MIHASTLNVAGRAIAYSDSGPQDGIPVLLCHGLPGAHVQIPDTAVLARHGVRMIIIDRPGFGLSDPHAGRSVASWRHDACAILDALGITQVILLPFSAGTPYALAFAQHHPERVSRLHIISGMGPSAAHDTANMSWFNRIQHRFGTTIPNWLITIVAAVSDRVIGKGAKAIPFGLWLMRNTFTPDENRYSRAPEGQVFRDMLAMSFHQGYHSYLQDLSLITGNWGIDMREIPHPAVCWYGDADKITPPEAGHRLHQYMPQLQMRIFPGVGHLLIFMYWDEVIAALAHEG